MPAIDEVVPVEEIALVNENKRKRSSLRKAKKAPLHNLKSAASCVSSATPMVAASTFAVTSVEAVAAIPRRLLFAI